MTGEIKYIGLDLSIASSALIEILLEDEDNTHEDFMEILTANINRPDIMKLILESPYVPEEAKQGAAKVLQLPVKFTEGPKQSKEERKQTLLQKLQRLTVGEKIAAALKGGSEIRSILFKDSNKEVSLTVLKNPKITPSEVEIIAHSRNIHEEALRLISKNREWMKEYKVMVAMVNNPKTPPGISSTLVSGMKAKDIAMLAKNKNVSEAVRITAKKLLETKRRQG